MGSRPVVFEVPPKLQQFEHVCVNKIEDSVVWERRAWMHQGLSEG